MTKHSPSILPLTLENAVYKAGNKKLLKDIACQFEAGNRYIIIGPNGAGKSLLLRLCHGLIKASQGKVKWLGDLNKEAQKHQAMVSQRPIMLRRTAWENIDFALSLKGIAKSKRQEIIEDVIDRTGLKRSAHKAARVLSLGEQQRLAIARAWALNPQVMFLDEPTASLDPPATHAIEELIQEISAEGTTVIMTSHDLGQARRLGTHALFMFRGHLKEMTDIDSFFDAPKNDLLRAFLEGKLIWWKRKQADNIVQLDTRCNTLEIKE